MKIFSADWIVPIAGEPLADGALIVENGAISAVGRRGELLKFFPHSEHKNFGAAAILPAFVNAHTHLELTILRGFLDSVENDFFAWLRKLTAARESLSIKDLEISATFGAIEMARAGIGCVGDAAFFGVAALKGLKNVGLRGVVFQETISPDESQADAKFSELKNKIEEMSVVRGSLVEIGASPHAPYSVSRRLFEKTADYAISANIKTMIHCAESLAEEDFLLNGAGIFSEFLRKREIIFQAPRLSTVKYLDKIGVLRSKPLLAHCVRVSDADIELIKKSGAKIAHCPKSNAKFGHAVAPLAKFLDAGISTGLGSDSVASNNTADMLEEARFAALTARANINLTEEKAFEKRFVTARDVLHAATLGGAKSLGLEGEIGSLEVGKKADFAVVNLQETAQMPVQDIEAALVFASNARDIAATYIEGHAVFEQGEITNFDESAAKNAVRAIAHKLGD